MVLLVNSLIIGNMSKAMISQRSTGISTVASKSSISTLAYLSVSEMDRVSIYAVSGHEMIPLFEKIIGRERFYENISKLNDLSFGGDVSFSDAIMRSDVGYGDGKSIFISDFLTDNDYLSAIDYLRDKHRDVLYIQLLAPEEIDPSMRGKNILYGNE